MANKNGAVKNGKFFEESFPKHISGELRVEGDEFFLEVA